MTHEQQHPSAQSGALDESTVSKNSEQHEPLDRSKMAFTGPLTHSMDEEVTQTSETWIPVLSVRHIERSDQATNTEIQNHAVTSRAVQTNTEYDIDDRPTKRARTSFYDFAAQTRLQRHHERRKQNLSARISVLQRSVALASRLKRSSAWVQDGLVEISKHQDTGGFVRTFSHAHDLVDSCYSHWNNEIQKLDILQHINSESQQTGTPTAFFDRLSPGSQNELLKLIRNLRSNPQFLIDKLSRLSLSQVATLTAKPKWEASESLLTSLSQQSGGSAQRRRRVQAFSKELEEYASAFERNDPFAFLIHNIYSNDSSPDSPEHNLRLWAWSSVCSGLLINQSKSYNSLYWQTLEAFSAMQGWPAKTRVELFLMDVLQRGALFIKEGSSQRGKSRAGSQQSQQEQEFFESAVLDLYWTLINCNTGCYPTGALEFAQAILGKLPNEDDQSDFRSHFFERWYLNHFLKTAIMYPENEDMLLKIHVSKQARECILAPLFNLFASKYATYMDEQTTEANQTIANITMAMVNMLEEKDTTNPYQKDTSNNNLSNQTPAISLCASECIKILETLSPQTTYSAHSSQAVYSAHYISDEVMQGIGNAFQAENLPRSRFDLLKQELTQLLEPGASAKDTHPCLEAWADFRIDNSGVVTRADEDHAVPFLRSLLDTRDLSLAQKAAIKLCLRDQGDCHDELPSSTDKWTTETKLRELLHTQIEQSKAMTNRVDALSWQRASIDLSTRYPLCLEGDDSLLLTKILAQIQDCKTSDLTHCDELEKQVGPWEKTFNNFKTHIQSFTTSLEGLRLKLWYTSEIVTSPRYINARNIALALSHMNILHLKMTQATEVQSKANARPASSRSTISSMFGTPRDEAIEVLKAPTEFGGPRKLADDQVESIKQWFQQNNIDNFCRGEERLHRFCMEVWRMSRSLTGETMLDSSELWGSTLFARESVSYDIGYTSHVNSAPASTRPASVFSDSAISSGAFPPPIRPSLRSPDSDNRSIMSDDRSSNRRGSVYRLFEGFAPSLASSMSSHGRASTAGTSISDVFSQASQSLTSASVYSRPPSILHGSLPNFAPRSHGSYRDRKKFRDKLRIGLTCLLLSDLGSLVWSWGCETDTWLSQVQSSQKVMDRMSLQLSSESLRSDVSSISSTTPRRRNSGPDTSSNDQQVESEDDVNGIDYYEALQDTLSRMSQQIDPVGKLKACLDFDALAMEQLHSLPDFLGNTVQTQAQAQSQRRGSDGGTTTIGPDRITQTRSNVTDNGQISEQRTVLHYKKQLAKLRPGTLFRDLQYIAVFTPPEMLDKTAAGKALMRLGVAALQYKKDLCNSLVHIAGKVMIADSIKRTASVTVEPTLKQAAEYWKIAAMEGNRAAQRELALMYLMHPEMLSIITLPLSPPSKIFRDEMMWQKTATTSKSRQALCLALHWMQQAAKEGDQVAQQKLLEREGEISLR